jgi:hypothetical protein
LFYSYTPLPDIEFDYNLYYNSVGSVGVIGDNEYHTLADWKVATGQEVHAVGGDPLFVSSSDFNLQSGSPAIDMGIDVGLPFNDFAPDIGAYESDAGTSPINSITFAKDANGNFIKDTNGNFIKIIN